MKFGLKEKDIHFCKNYYKTMENTKFKIYPYRWVVLCVYMLIIAVNQLLWITFAPITCDAAKYFGVSDFQIGILSMCFMIVFIIFSIPASWIIDKYGIRIGVGIGVLFTGLFGLMRGLVSEDFNSVLMSQIGIAIGQPFLLNAITKLAARWFPIKDRATASGLGTLSMYIGIFGGMVLTPYLTEKTGIASTLHIYGIISVISAILFFMFIKENPPTAPCRADQQERSLVLDGFKNIFHIKDFNLLLVVFFIGLGIFNCVTTWIENILGPRGFTATQAGTAGGVMILSGIMGAFIMPLLSDYFQKRKPFIIMAIIGATFGLVGITFATSYWLMLFSGAVLGFFLLSAGPIGFQYGAEVTYPISEGTSNGFLLLMGQISGILFIFGLDYFKSPIGSMTQPLVVLIVLMALLVIFTTRLKESALLSADEDE